PSRPFVRGLRSGRGGPAVAGPRADGPSAGGRAGAAARGVTQKRLAPAAISHRPPGDKSHVGRRRGDHVADSPGRLSDLVYARLRAASYNPAPPDLGRLPGPAVP